MKSIANSAVVMKSFVVFFCALVLGFSVTSCSDDDDVKPSYSEYTSLFSTVSTFVTKLSASSSNSYPISGSSKKTTSDGKFVVTPMGRLIGVAPKSSMSTKELTKVKEALEWKFGDKACVNEIFLNSGGGITINCRR